MTDMTAEQALAWFVSQAECLADLHDTNHEKVRQAEQALTAPRLPEGFEVKRHRDGSIRVSWKKDGAHKSIWCNPEGSEESPMEDMGETMLWLLADALLTSSPAPAEHVARVGTMEVTMDDECRVSRAVLRDAADVLRDYTDKPREAAPAPADPELTSPERNSYDKVIADQDSELARLLARVKVLEGVLLSAYGAMNFMGDILNSIDAVTTEDVEKTADAFEKVSSIAASLRGGSDE